MAIEPPPLMTPEEVGTLWRVDPKTASRWAKTGRITGKKTPGGHWRFDRAEVEAAFNDAIEIYGEEAP